MIAAKPPQCLPQPIAYLCAPCRAVPCGGRAVPCRFGVRSLPVMDGGGAGLIPSERVEPILLADYALFLLNRFHYRSVSTAAPCAAGLMQ